MQDEKVLTILKTKYLQQKNLDKTLGSELKPDPAVIHIPKPTKIQIKKFEYKMSSLKLHEHFVNKIDNDERRINRETLKEYFRYHNESFLAKDLYKTKKIKKKPIRNRVNDALIKLKNSIN